MKILVSCIVTLLFTEPLFAQDVKPLLYTRIISPNGTTIQISASELIRAGKLSAIYFYTIDSTKFTIISYGMSMFCKGKDPVLDLPAQGDAFTAEMISCITRARAGDKIYFERIIVYAGGDRTTQRTLPPLGVTITGP